MELKKRPVIFDCDPGVDDAVALFMMLAADDQFDLLGVCPVDGNKSLWQTEKNSCILLELAGKTEIPVFHGADKALIAERRVPENIHGATGLGGVVLPDPVKTVEKKYAWDFMYEMAKKYPHELEILAVGPYTNIATAMLKYPDFSALVKKIVIMGGAITGGNQTAAAEFNVWADAWAARIMFQSGIPIVMIGLEICFEGRISGEWVKKIDSIGGPVSKVAAQLIGEREVHSKGKGAVLCDAIAAAYMIDPSIITVTDEEYVEVDVKGGYSYGATVGKRCGGMYYASNVVPNTTICWHIDDEKFCQLIYDSCKKLDDQLQ